MSSPERTPARAPRRRTPPALRWIGAAGDSLRGRLRLGLAAAGLLLASAAGVGWWATRGLSPLIRESLAGVEVRGALVTQLAVATVKARSAGDAYLLAPTPATRAAFVGYTQDVRTAYGLLGARVSNDDVARSALRTYRAHALALGTAYGQAIRLVDAGRRAEASALMDAQAARTHAMYAALADLAGIEAGRVAVTVARLERESAQRAALLLALLAGGSLCGVVLVRTTIRSLTLPLEALGAHARALSDGDLAARTELRGLPGEFRTLARAMNGAAASLERAHEERTATITALHAREAEVREAERAARDTASRLSAVAHAVSGVIAADSPEALGRVLRSACADVMGFEAFAFVTYESTHGGDAAHVADAAEAEALLAVDGRSVLAVPVTASGVRLGEMHIARDAAVGFAPDDAEVLEAVAALAATALRNLHLLTEIQSSEERFAHQAYHDALTGLANRTRFREKLGASLAHAPAAMDEVAPSAVLLVDLDGFKAVNDGLGHDAGDALLVAVARRLLNATRGSDTVARLGGDEFGVLLDRLREPRDATIVAERVVQSLRIPFSVNGRPVTIGASVGVAFAREAHRRDADALMRDADAAMYAAKHGGKSAYAVYDPEAQAAAAAGQLMDAELRQAIARGQLWLAYQPLVGLEDGAVRAVEALARWTHPGLGIVSPGEFIPRAERSGLIVPLGRWVLREACRQAAEWEVRRAAHTPERPPLTVSVNVSARQLHQHDFVDDVAETLRLTGLSPRLLMLEITETVIVEQPELVRERLGALRALGLRVAIDDFGDGYTSIAHLRRFPVDVLKLCMAFVDGVAEQPESTALATAVVAMARALNLETVAEGIEEPAQQAALRTLGCDHGQGYLFARPMPPAELERLLDARSAPAVAVPPSLPWWHRRRCRRSPRRRSARSSAAARSRV
jgi:diguanylate cyclase (GGDEF)-like protein